jgi:parallel beta-helix repeat protein
VLLTTLLAGGTAWAATRGTVVAWGNNGYGHPVALAGSGTSRYVNPGGSVAGCPATAGKTYNTVQEAVGAAGQGDAIFVCPGTYQENVLVHNKSKLTIRNYALANQPPPTIDALAGAFGFQIADSNEVTIQGLHITNARFGVDVSTSSKTTVQNCLIDASRVGIFFFETSTKNRALKNIITNILGDGISLWGAGTVAEDNIITNAGNGIRIVSASGAKVHDNLLNNNRQDGIRLFGATSSSIDDNMASFNGHAGISVATSNNNKITENHLQGNGHAGISNEADSIGNTYSENTLQWNTVKDAEELSIGSATAGTASSWIENTCDVSAPAGLCAAPATGP